MEKSFTAAAPGAATPAIAQAIQTRFDVLGAISFSHFLNDMMQSLIVAIYPLLKGEFHLSFVQIGVITLTYQICASVLQPVIGVYTYLPLLGMVAAFLPDIEHRSRTAGALSRRALTTP